MILCITQATRCTIIEPLPRIQVVYTLQMAFTIMRTCMWESDSAKTYMRIS